MSLSVTSSSSVVTSHVESAEPAVPPAVVETPPQSTPAGVGATASGFDAASGTASVDSTPPVRGTEVASLLSTPDTVPAADCVRAETKVDSIVQAALPTERDAVRQHFERASADAVDAAFTKVLEASQTAGTRAVELGPFTGNVSVTADGKVNGAPLPSDRELSVAAELANLSQDDRRQQLRQVGVDEAFLGHASDRQLVRAFNEVELTRRFGSPGDHSVSLQTGAEADVKTSRLDFTVGAGGTVAATGQALARPTSESALRELRARELAEWPAGKPETRTSTLAPNESVKFATLLSVLPQDQAKELRAARAFITNDSINAAYDRFLETKGTPGKHSFSFELDASRPVPTGLQTESGEEMKLSPVPSYRLTASLDVGADGQVNGKPVLADEVVRLAKQTEPLAPAVKDLLLRNAGVSDEWLTGATFEKDLVLAQLRLASKSSGDHTIDLQFDRHEDPHSESGGSIIRRSGSISVTADASGKLDGKPQLIDAAIATHAAMDKLPMAEKRLMMSQLGVPSEAVRNIRPADATAVLSSVAMLTTSPGQHSFDFNVAGKPWMMGLSIGAGGAIEGVGAQRIPEQSFGREFFDFACTVVSVAFPAVAPIVGIVRTAVAYEQGQRGLGLVAQAAAAVAGGAELAGASWAATANTVATALSATNGVYQAAKTGDPLTGLSSLVSLAFAAGDLSGTPLDSKFDLLKTVGQVAAGARALIDGDVSGLASQAFGAVTRHEDTLARTAVEDANELTRLLNKTTTAEEAAGGPTGTDFSLGTARLGDATSGTRLGTGDEGSALRTDDAVGPVGDRSVVRRIDNELEAQRPQTREDFDRAFAAARRGGEATFSFDMNDGRGAQQYTTGTRQERAAALPGGSAADYERIVKSYFGGKDSDLAFAAYREALRGPANSPTPTVRTGTTGPATETTPDRASLGRQVADFLDWATGSGHGLNFFKPNDPAATGLDHPATRDPNLFVVTGHGNTQAIKDDRVTSNVVNAVGQWLGLAGETSTEVRAEDLAARILSSNWNGQSVVLLSCNAGTGGSTSYAQRLSNLLGVPVAAGDGYVGSDARGSSVTTGLGPGGSLNPNENLRGLTWFRPQTRTGTGP